MSAEILISCAQCNSDIGVILGTGSRDDLAELRCWRCDAGLPPLPKPGPAPLPEPHHCPPTAMRIYKTGWKCCDCGRFFTATEVVAAVVSAESVTSC